MFARLLLVTLLSLGATHVYGNAGIDEAIHDALYGKITRDELISALSRDAPETDFATLMSFLGRMSDDKTIGQILLAIWNQDRTKFPGFAWERLSMPLVRIMLAMTLARFYPEDSDNFCDFLRNRLASEDPHERAHAALALGAIGSDNEVPRLRMLAESDPPPVKIAAISALGTIGTNAACSALRDIAKNSETDSSMSDAIRLALEKCQTSSRWKSNAASRPCAR